MIKDLVNGNEIDKTGKKSSAIELHDKVKKTGYKTVTKVTPNKGRGVVFTVRGSSKNEDDERIRRLAATGTMSYTQAQQYVQKHPKGKGKEKDTGASKPKINLQGYSVMCLVSKDKLEGIIIASKDRLFEGFFFLGKVCALNFLSTQCDNSFSYKKDIKQLKVETYADKKVDFISGDTERPSVAQRRKLCWYIAEAIKQNPEDSGVSDEQLVTQLFKNEYRLKTDELAKFVDDKLYIPENEGQVPPCNPPEEGDSNGATSDSSSATNQFYDHDVLMEGTRECAKLVKFPRNKAMSEYVVPQYVDTICTGAFNKTKKLEAVRIGSGVKHIEKEAFADNSSLACITIPKNVEVVEDGAFSRCHNLLAAVVLSRSSEISPKMFTDCHRLGSITTANESLRKSLKAIRESSKSKVELKTHTNGQAFDYPYLDHNDKIIVMGNIYNCLTHVHSIKALWVNVPIRENGKDKSAPICVFRCNNCKKKFILPDIYEYYLMRYDFANTKLFVPIEYSPWYTGLRMSHIENEVWGLEPQSILKELGYNVNSSIELSSATRVNILKSGIEHGIVTKEEVEQYLEFFIRYLGARAGMETAVSKWKSDLATIHNMRFENIRYSS